VAGFSDGTFGKASLLSVVMLVPTDVPDEYKHLHGAGHHLQHHRSSFVAK
jgi:hypothetical protein